MFIVAIVAIVVTAVVRIVAGFGIDALMRGRSNASLSGR